MQDIGYQSYDKDKLYDDYTGKAYPYFEKDYPLVGFSLYDIKRELYDSKRFELFTTLCQKHIKQYNTSFGFDIKDIISEELNKLDMSINEYYFNFLAYLAHYNLVKKGEITLNAFDQFCYRTNFFSFIDDARILMITKDVFSSSNFNQNLLINALENIERKETYAELEIDLNGISEEMLTLIIRNSRKSIPLYSNENHGMHKVDDIADILPNTTLILIPCVENPLDLHWG